MSIKNAKQLSAALQAVTTPICRHPLTPRYYYQTCTKCGNRLKRRKDRLEEIPVCKNCKNSTHGLTRYGIKTPEFSRWENMISRCYSTTDDSYAWYGAKGITVCDEWKNPNTFSDWCFTQIKGKYINTRGLHIHRIDTSKNYTPDNCVLLIADMHISLHRGAKQ